MTRIRVVFTVASVVIGLISISHVLARGSSSYSLAVARVEDGTVYLRGGDGQSAWQSSYRGGPFRVVEGGGVAGVRCETDAADEPGLLVDLSNGDQMLLFVNRTPNFPPIRKLIFPPPSG